MSDKQQLHSAAFSPTLSLTQVSRPQHIHTVSFAQPIPIEREASVWYLMTSGVAAAVSRTVTSPLERLKLLRQIGSPNFAGVGLQESLVKIYKLEGVKGYFRGNGANILRIVPFSAIEFHSFVFFKDLILPPGDPRHKVRLIYCGALAGITASVLTYPLDFIRTVLTVQTPYKYKGFRDATMRIYRKKGPFAFYRGLFPSLLVLPTQGIVPYIALKMTTYDLLKIEYYPQYSSPCFKYVTLLYGALAAIVATTLTYPWDLIRRKVQLIVNVTQSVEPVPYHNLRSAISYTFNSEGCVGFFKGLVPRYLKVFPVAATAFWVNENLKVGLHIR